MTRLDLPGHDVVGIRAANPGPFTLAGTNTWILGRDPAWLVDPGPALEAHVEAVSAEIDRRGDLGGIALTHDHADHIGAVPALRARFPNALLAAARGEVDDQLADGSSFGPLVAVATPGHSPDHLAYVSGKLGLTGDAVLGHGSVFIFPDPGALAAYLDGLNRLRALDLAIIAPGHGPLVQDVEVKL
jgi:glyoxylase-like metal-dependent hydrolase (beta-lactamase superfamily II)